jgi:hypothetical protein
MWLLVPRAVCCGGEEGGAAYLQRYRGIPRSLIAAARSPNERLLGTLSLPNMGKSPDFCVRSARHVLLSTPTASRCRALSPLPALGQRLKRDPFDVNYSRPTPTSWPIDASQCAALLGRTRCSVSFIAAPPAQACDKMMRALGPVQRQKGHAPAAHAAPPSDSAVKCAMPI